MTLSPRPLRLLALVALAAALAACGRDQAAASNRGSGGGDAPVTVTTTVLQPRSFADSIVAIGTARARESITITAKVSETVQAVHFDSGDEVGQGAVLVTLSGNQQISRFGNQYVLVRDGDAYYRLQADGCDKLSLATRFELQAESQAGRICPRDTLIETNTGKCKAAKAELIDEATYLRYQRRR